MTFANKTLIVTLLILIIVFVNSGKFKRVEIARNRGREDGICFNYTNVDGWPDIFGAPPNQCICTKFADNLCFCDGPKKRQSPIDIRTNEVNSNCPISLSDRIELIINEPSWWIVENTDHNIELLPEYFNGETSQTNPVIRFKNPYFDPAITTENEEYCFQQIHFHFASDDKFGGSEHLVDGEAYATEAHLVFHSCDFTDVRDAIIQTDIPGNRQDPNSLAVIALFFDGGFESNDQIDKIFTATDVLNDLKYSRDICKNLTLSCEGETLTKDFRISELLPSVINNFYTYDGSLTTPGCTEIVRWFVLKQTVPISMMQLDGYFRNQLFAKEYVILGNNFRPVQNTMNVNANNQTVFDCDLMTNDEIILFEEAVLKSEENNLKREEELLKRELETKQRLLEIMREKLGL